MTTLPGIVTVATVAGITLYDVANGPDWSEGDSGRYSVESLADGFLGEYDTVAEALTAHPELCDTAALREAEAELRAFAIRSHYDDAADDVTPEGARIRETADALDSFLADAAGFTGPLAPLAVEWAAWCKAQGFEACDALELIMSEPMTSVQMAFVQNFIVRWDAAESAFVAAL